MSMYTVVGRDNDGNAVTVSVGFDQDLQMVAEMSVVNAVRDCLTTTSGITSVTARKYEQIITVV